MVGEKAERSFDRRLPVHQGLAGRAKDEVEIDIVKLRAPGSSHRRFHRREIVLAIEDAQDPRVGGLHPDAQTIEPMRRKSRA